MKPARKKKSALARRLPRPCPMPSRPKPRMPAQFLRLRPAPPRSRSIRLETDAKPVAKTRFQLTRQAGQKSQGQGAEGGYHGPRRARCRRGCLTVRPRRVRWAWPAIPPRKRKEATTTGDKTRLADKNKKLEAPAQPSGEVPQAPASGCNAGSGPQTPTVTVAFSEEARLAIEPRLFCVSRRMRPKLDRATPSAGFRTPPLASQSSPHSANKIAFPLFGIYEFSDKLFH